MRAERGLANYFSGLEAGGADVLALGVATNQSADTLNIRIPAAAGTALGVRDIVTKTWAFAADVAYRCHDDSLTLQGAQSSR